MLDFLKSPPENSEKNSEQGGEFMTEWRVLPKVDIGHLVEPHEFRAVRNTRGDRASLVRDIWERFPNQPPMPSAHPAMLIDAAMSSGRKPVFLMHPIDGKYFPYSLRLSNKINAAKREAETFDNDRQHAAQLDAKAIQLSREHVSYRIEVGAMQRLGQSSLIKNARLHALEKMNLARALGNEAALAAKSTGAPALQTASPVARLEAALPPLSTATPAVLASQSAAAAAFALSTYQTASQMQISAPNVTQTLGAVPAVSSITFKV